MKRYLFIVIILIVMCLGVTLFGRSNGKVSIIFGKAYIMEYIKAYKKSLLTANKVILPKDIIVTSSNGTVIVRLADKSTVVIRPSSRVQFSFVSRNSQRLALGSGGIMARVNKLRSKSGFNINTPNSVAGVRGTRLIVEYNEYSKDYSVNVYSGRVDYSPLSKTDRVTLALTKGNALSYASSKNLLSISEANKNILNGYKELLVGLAPNISGWEFN